MKRLPLYILLILMMLACKTKKAGTMVAESPVNQTLRYYFYEAERATQLNQYDRAMALWLYCEQLDSTDAAVQQNLAYLYNGLQQNEKALMHYKKAFEADNKMYWQHYVSMLLDRQQYDEAEQVLKQAQKAAPDNIEILEGLSLTYKAKKEYKKALQVQDEIIKKEGIDQYNTMAAYNIASTMGDNKRAVKYIEDYLKENPDDTRFQAFLGDLYAMTNRPQALPYYQSQLQKHPQDPYLLMSLYSYYIEEKDTVQAEDYLHRAFRSQEWDLQQKLANLKRIPQNADGTSPLLENILGQLMRDYPTEGIVYQQLANYYIGRGELWLARPIMRYALELSPSQEADWSRYLQVLQADSTSTNDEYEWCIDHAYQQFPTSLEWSYWRCRMYLAQQDVDSAIEVAENGVKSESSEFRYRAGLWILLGDLYASREQYDDAFNAYEEVLKIDSKHTYTLNNYAYLLALHGNDLKKAERMSQITIEQEPNNALYLDTYAWILHLQGENMLAQFYIKKAIDNLKDEPEEEIRAHYQIIMQK